MRRFVFRALGFVAVLVGIGLVRTPTAHAIVPDVFEITAGIKAGAGLEIWTEPSGATRDYLDSTGATQSFDIPFFDETRAGFNTTIGAFIEFRFVRHIGLEVGMLITRHKLLEDTDWTYTEVDQGTGQIDRFKTKTEQTLVFTGFHIPILLKGILPVGDSVRLSLGVGPEFFIGSYAYATFKIAGGDDLKGSRAVFKDLEAESQTDTYLAIQFGVDIKAGDFRVPIDLRFGYNFNQPDNYYDRVQYRYDGAAGGGLPWETGDANDHPTHGTFQARNSMYLQLLIGVAFDY